MSNAYMIEVGEETVGIVARDGGAYVFYAATRAFEALDKKHFASPRHAEKAAYALARSQAEKAGAPPKLAAVNTSYGPEWREAS